MANGSAVEAQQVAGAITSMRIDELISNLAIGIAEGQMQLDLACMDIAQFMGTAQIAFGKRPGSDEPDELSLIELGFSPNFYQFVDTILEVRVAVSSQFEETREYDTSLTQLQQQEAEAQSEYEASSSYSYGGSSSYGGWSGGWGWGHGYGGSSSYAGSGGSRYGSRSSYKSKNLALTTVDAKYSSTYNYAVEGSSMIKTKIVPVPPPEVFEETVRAKLEQRREAEALTRSTAQASDVVSTVLAAADDALAHELLSETPPDPVTTEHAASLRTAVARARDAYAALTADLWSVVTGVEDRRAADAAVAAAVDAAGEIDIPPEIGSLPADAFSAQSGDDVDAVGENLTAFRDTMLSVHDRLAQAGPA